MIITLNEVCSWEHEAHYEFEIVCDDVVFYLILQSSETITGEIKFFIWYYQRYPVSKRKINKILYLVEKSFLLPIGSLRHSCFEKYTGLMPCNLIDKTARNLLDSFQNVYLLMQ
jgi:hypothetical protein